MIILFYPDLGLSRCAPGFGGATSCCCKLQNRLSVSVRFVGWFRPACFVCGCVGFAWVRSALICIGLQNIQTKLTKLYLCKINLLVSYFDSSSFHKLILPINVLQVHRNQIQSKTCFWSELSILMTCLINLLSLEKQQNTFNKFLWIATPFSSFLLATVSNKQHFSEIF